MSVRILTIQEMLALPHGAMAITAKTVSTGSAVLKPGTPLTKRDTIWGNDHISVAFCHSDGDWDFFEEGEVAAVEFQPTKEQLARPAEELGVYRPDLNTRKVGKVRVELVDDGFPLALREVAKVMTWAQTAKGYKDHDWQNLPNAEQALSAATSRHRSDYIMQRMIGDLPASECVDPESDLIHKAHEAFGVLAQLELALRGRFEGRAAQL